MIVGGAVGYVLGARAGRDRYEQIKRWAVESRKHPAVAQLSDHAVGLVDAGRYTVAASLSAGAKGLKAVDSSANSE